MLPRVVVKDPVIHNTWKNGKFTTYLICVKTDHPSFHLHLSAVRRRFSELRWLHKVLRTNHPQIHFPATPSRKLFGERFDTEFLNSRTRDIENFLNKLISTDTVLSDTAFHLFLQTDLTTLEIDEYINGTLPESMVEKTWQNSGHLHVSNHIINEQAIPREPQEIVMNEEDVNYHRQMYESSSDSNFHSSLENSTTYFETRKDDLCKLFTPMEDRYDDILILNTASNC